MRRQRGADQEDRPLSALIYIRVSGKEQEREGLSLPAQLRDCQRYCAERGWGIESQYRDVLRGTRDDRLQYQALLADVRRLRAEGKRVVVVVKWLHRLGRRVLESVRCREEFKALGVPIHSIMEGGEVDDLRANIMASVAQYEVQQLGERVSETFRDVQELGWHKGGKTAWGYLLRDATESERKAGSPKKVLDLDEAAAPHVREAFRRAAEGATLRSLARWAAALPVEARAYKALSYAAIRNVLKSPTYIARQPWGDQDVLARPTCRWPALVDDATWLRVQERIGAHARMPRQASGRHLLTGLIRCPACGARMGGESALVRNGKVVYAARYRCKGHLYGAGHADRCCTAAAHMRTVDQAVTAEASRVLAAYAAVGDRAFMAGLRRAWHELQTTPETADVARRVRQREAEVAKAQQRLQALTYKLIDQAIDDETYRTMKTDIERARDAARAELQRLRGARARPTLPPLDHVLGRIGGWQEALGKFDVAHQREILGELIERVVPIRTSRQRGRGTPYGHEVKIDWTDQGEALRKIAGILTPVPA